MKSVNEMKLSFPARSVNESFARVAVSGFIAQLDPTIEEIADIKTAVSEAVTNAIIHGYKDKPGLVYINTRIYDGGKIVIKIKDNGCGIPDIKQAMQPTYTTCSGEERAGLGFAVMETFMDKVKVYSKVDSGTSVVMSKSISSKK